MQIQASNNTLALKDSLPKSDNGHFISTTRNHKFAVDLVGSYVISISELDERTGMKFLKKLLIQKDLLNESSAAITLHTQLTFLPLEITQAATYINQNRTGLSG